MREECDDLHCPIWPVYITTRKRQTKWIRCFFCYCRSTNAICSNTFYFSRTCKKIKIDLCMNFISVISYYCFTSIDQFFSYVDMSLHTFFWLVLLSHFGDLCLPYSLFGDLCLPQPKHYPYRNQDNGSANTIIKLKSQLNLKCKLNLF